MSGEVTHFEYNDCSHHVIFNDRVPLRLLYQNLLLRKPKVNRCFLNTTCLMKYFLILSFSLLQSNSMASPKRVLKHLAKVQRCPLEPLAEHLFTNTELAYLFELRTHDNKPYLHVDLYKLMAYHKDITSTDYDSTQMHLMYMSDMIEICLEGYEFRHRI